MSVRHAAVWLDHSEAHILALGPDAFEKRTVKNHGARHQHHKAGSVGSGHAHDAGPFFSEIATELAGAQSIYLCGPGSAKQEFIKDAEARHSALRRRIVKVDAADHPTDAQLASEARKFFKAYEQTTPLG